jgi:hypothetical protein
MTLHRKTPEERPDFTHFPFYGTGSHCIDALILHPVLGFHPRDQGRIITVFPTIPA